MGADIHAYVEYSKDGKFWQNLTENFGSRNYLLFGIMANVRYEGLCLYDPRGLPEGDLGYVTRGAYYMNVAPDDKPDWKDFDGWTSAENAQRWIDSGCSEPTYRDGKLDTVTNPDYHSTSWLTADEMSNVTQIYRDEAIKLDWEPDSIMPWEAIVNAMRTFESSGWKTRIVFWFDN